MRPNPMTTDTPTVPPLELALASPTDDEIVLEATSGWPTLQLREL